MTHSFPTRRSADLSGATSATAASKAASEPGVTSIRAISVIMVSPMNDAPGRYHAPGRSKCARNHQALNIGRAFVYLADAHVAIDFREAELLQIAIAAKRLDCARAHRQIGRAHV